MTTATDSPIAPAAEPRYALLLHSQLLGQRLQLFGYLRYGVALTIAVGALFARYVVGIEQLDVYALILIATVIAIYNLITSGIIRPYRDPDKAEQAVNLLVWIRHATVLLDYLALTVLIHYVGGARSPFLAFYLLHLGLGGIMMSRRANWIHCLLAYLMLTSLVVGEGVGLIQPHMPAGAVSGNSPLDGRYVLTVLVVYAILFALMTYLITGLAHLLRLGEQRLQDVNRQLSHLSRHRRDFLHVALHNLKSPVSAVTMLLTSLRDGLIGPLAPSQQQAVERCLGRLRGCADFIRDLQNLAAIESGDLDEQYQPFDIRPLLEDLTTDYADLIDQHHHRIAIELADQPLVINAVQRLIREALANFLTNAIKYTPDGGTITLRAMREDNAARIDVIDTGVGIDPADQQHLFDEFVRIRHKNTPVDKVPGTGLGLSIVKRIIHDHHGSVTLASEPGRGSTFTIRLPLADTTPAQEADSLDPHPPIESTPTITVRNVESLNPEPPRGPDR